MNSSTTLNEEFRDIAILVALDSGNQDWSVEDSLDELERLASTANVVCVGRLTQRLRAPHNRSYIGPGKLDELIELTKATNANLIIFDDELSPRQQTNIENSAGENIRVTDRTALILDIFAMHATTREGKLQVELATLEYELPRLRGMWSHLEKEKLGGGVGARFGMGESQLETDRRIARRRIAELKRELVKVDSERKIQRQRRGESGVFRIALVGYTNAGKSTLLNALTGADVLAYDKLFATLDSTTRKFSLPSGRRTTLTDTVGFINKLPHGLVAAFKSTLDEVNEADLLLHVVDGSSPMYAEQIGAVQVVLEEIGAHTKPVLTVFNKVDNLDDESIKFQFLAQYPGSIAVSARTREGLDDLLASIETAASKSAPLVTALIPFTRGELVQLAHERATIIEERYTENGTFLTLRLPQQLVAQFEEFVTESGS